MDDLTIEIAIGELARDGLTTGATLQQVRERLVEAVHTICDELDLEIS